MRILEEGRPSSTAPCFPAPSRRLVILKNDPPASTQGVLLDFIPTSTASQRPKSTGPPTFTAIMEQQTQNTAEEDNFSIGKRWSQIRNAFGFKATVTETPADGNTSPPKTPNRSSISSISSTASEEVVLPPPPAASFKFSLEWMEHRMMGREQELRESRLPRTAQEFYDSLSEEYRPTEELLATISSNYITYVGRSLAEWRLIVIEHENFIDRRRKEGRPTDNDVETPTLGVDSMRKF